MISTEANAVNSAVWVRLDGGLGNQMFQYAFGRVLADARGRELILDASGLARRRHGVTPRSYALAPLRVRATVHAGKVKVSEPKLRGLRRLPLLASLCGVRNEVGPDHDPSAAEDPRVHYWAGYWQSPRYFQHAAPTLFSDFTPAVPLSASARSFIEGVEFGTSVVLHVRRGDYVSLSSAAGHHGATSLDYYRQAVDQCLEAVPHARIYVFSDDVAWCRTASVAGRAPQVIYVEPDPMREDWEELWMMSHCGHHIIANSSFSWWSSWLADQRYGLEARHVWAPRRWFLTQPIRTADRFPPHWNLL